MSDSLERNIDIDMLAELAERLSLRRYRKRYYHSKPAIRELIRGVVILQNFRTDLPAIKVMGIVERPPVDPELITKETVELAAANFPTFLLLVLENAGKYALDPKAKGMARKIDRIRHAVGQNAQLDMAVKRIRKRINDWGDRDLGELVHVAKDIAILEKGTAPMCDALADLGVSHLGLLRKACLGIRDAWEPPPGLTEALPPMSLIRKGPPVQKLFSASQRLRLYRLLAPWRKMIQMHEEGKDTGEREGEVLFNLSEQFQRFAIPFQGHFAKLGLSVDNVLDDLLNHDAYLSRREFIGND